MKKPNGYILFENDLIVVIATGLVRPSDNAKTGGMVQIWILVKAENPVAASKSGADEAVCGDCPLRGVNGSERVCYVNLGQAPLGIWKAWERGAYPKAGKEDLKVFLSLELSQRRTRQVAVPAGQVDSGAIFQLDRLHSPMEEPHL